MAIPTTPEQTDARLSVRSEGERRKFTAAANRNAFEEPGRRDSVA